MPAPLPRRVKLMCALLALNVGLALAAPDVFIAYPEPNDRVAYPNVILEGSVTPGATLTVNGTRVNVGPDGLFMEYWPLKVGVNTLKLVATLNGQTGVNTMKVTRTTQNVLPATPTAIARTSVTPRENIEFWDVARDTPQERTVQVSFQGSPGGRASFRVAGGAAQPMREGPAGTYRGATILTDSASFRNVAVDVVLTGRDGKTVKASAPGRLTSTLGALKTGVQKPGTIPGLGINDAVNSMTTLDGQPIMYPRDGMTFTLVGRQGADVRARLAPGYSVLITAEQLSLFPGAPALAQAGAITTDPAGVMAGSLAGAGLGLTPAITPAITPANPPAQAAVTVPVTPPPATPDTTAQNPQVIELTSAPGGMTPATPAPVTPPPVAPAPATTAPMTSGPAPVPTKPEAVIRLPLYGAKVPFQLRQVGHSQLQLTLFGVLVPPTVTPSTDPLVRNITVLPGAGQVTILIDLNTAQTWGFSANFEGQELVVRLRRPPVLAAASPLLGRVITLDPGHGGTQKGGAGSLRVPEKNIVLPIALRVAELLKAQGASVNLTRTQDVTLGLYERDLTAEAAGSDLLVSIHANALPDGRNPKGIRGPEVHFTHPQAQALSQSILNQLRLQLPELEAGKGLMPDANLALTRPTTQISLLVETAYLTDAGNLRVLMSSDGRERFAQAIAQGITDFYHSQITP